MARATKKTTKTITEHEIKKMKVSDLKAWDENPREISDEAMAGLTRSVEEFGLVQPIVWNKKTKRVVGGHQRLQVLRNQGIEKTNVVVVDLSEEREKVLNITLNNPEIAGTFSDDIGPFLKGIENEDANLFDELKLDSLLRELGAIKYEIPKDNKEIDEDAMKDTKNKCPKCDFEW